MAHDELPTLELAFPGPLRDSGVAAILAGEKTALTGLLQLLKHAGEPLPQPGDRFSVLDSQGHSAAIIELTDVQLMRFGDVDDRYAHAEGRGYSDAEQWRQAHKDFFQSEGVTAFLGEIAAIDDKTLIVTQRFRLVDPTDASH